MRKFLTATCAIPAFLLAIPALAEGSDAADPVDPGQGIDEQIHAFIQNLDDEYGVVDVTYRDMSMNGQTEALVIIDNCDEFGCEWSLVAHQEGGPRIVGSSWGDEVEFADAGEGALVWSDGITWAYSGDVIYPFGDILSNLRSFEGSEDEYEFIVENTGFTDSRDMNLSVYMADLTEDDGNEKVFIIRGFCCNAGSLGYPFVIASASGEILADGHSIDIPSIFRTSGGTGSYVIPNLPVGYEVIRIE